MCMCSHFKRFKLGQWEWVLELLDKMPKAENSLERT